MQDAAILSAIGIVDIDVNMVDIVDEVRVYEDYNHVDADGVLNSSKYPLDDPLFYQYAHFSGSDTTSAIIQVPENAYFNVRVDSNNTDKFSMFLAANSLCALHSEEAAYDGFMGDGIDCGDISKEDLQKMLEPIKQMLRVYMSYKKSSSGITLYANY